MQWEAIIRFLLAFAVLLGLWWLIWLALMAAIEWVAGW